VYRFWEANGTAYMAMPFYEGLTLKATLAAMRRPPDEARLREWLAPLLDALSVMHEARCFHRDIAPDNILLTREGPVLLDFGAARRVIGDMTHALTVVLKPGYAPIEQYGDTTMQQGAWTDLYALACVVYYAITGRTPISSIERMLTGDGLEPLSRVAAGRYSASFLQAVDAALAIQPKDRPQDVKRFRALMDGVAAPQATVVKPPKPGPEVPKPDDLTIPPFSSAPAKSSAAKRPAAKLESPEPSEGEGASLAWLAAAGSVIAAGVAVWLVVRPAPTTPPPAAPVAVERPLPTLVMPEAAPAAIAAPAPAPDPAPLPVTITSGTRATTVPDAAASAAAALGLPPPAVQPAAGPATIAPKRPTRVTAAPQPAAKAAKPPRCTDILQKASLEPLTAEEAAYLRRECR
jgi:hypothetical protein